MKPIPTQYICLLLICFIIDLPSLVGQTGYVKSTNHEAIYQIDIDDIIFSNDQLYIRGNVFIDSINRWGLFTMDLDTNGIIANYSYMYDTTLLSHIIVNTPSRFILDPDGSKIIPIYLLSGKGLALTKINSFGEVEFTTEYPHIDRQIYAIDVKRHADFYYIFGRAQRQDYHGDTYVIKTKLDGELIWFKYYGRIDHEDWFGDVIQNENGTFTISSSRATDDWGDLVKLKGWKAPWVYTIDTSGQILQEWLGQENDTTTLGGGPFCRANNGDWIIASRDFKEFPYILSTEVRCSPTITRLDSNFNLIWKINLTDYTSSWDIIQDMEYDPVRDEIIATGDAWPLVGPNQSRRSRIWIIKLDGEGNILWENFSTGPHEDIHERFTAGLALAPSGSAYVSGWDPQGGGRGWIIKVTPDGCMDTICSTTSIADQILRMNEVVSIFPNPIDDHITVHLKAKFKDPTLVIYDVYGRVIQQTKLDLERSTIPIDLFPGLYVFAVFSGGQVVHSARMIKG